MLWVLKLLPGVSSFLQWAGNIGIQLYSSKLAAEGAHDAKVVELAARELELDQLEARLNAQAKTEIRHIWYAPENLFGYIAISYWAKVITFDIVLGSIFDLGWNTPFLEGSTAVGMNMIMTFWLGKRGIENVASIISAAFGKR